MAGQWRPDDETTEGAYEERFACVGLLRMPLEYRIEIALRTLFTTAFGALTDEDVHRHVEDLRNEPDFRPDFNQLFDGRDVTRLELSGACVREIATARMFGEGSLRAIVVGMDLGFGMARMFELLRDDAPEQIRVFRNIDDARAWLGLPVEK
jgi:hypothetical protein